MSQVEAVGHGVRRAFASDWIYQAFHPWTTPMEVFSESDICTVQKASGCYCCISVLFRTPRRPLSGSIELESCCTCCTRGFPPASLLHSRPANANSDVLLMFGTALHVATASSCY